MGRFSTKHILLLMALLLALGCESGGVGDPCTPEDEYLPTFAGFAETEANTESRSFQCETRVCLAYHFRGRVSCPYGQNVPELGKDGVVQDVHHSERCHIPGSPDELVTVPVQPQLVERQPDDAVYCSCRCGGEDKNARYCECPSGFICKKDVIPNIGQGGEELAGSYCVRSGTDKNPEDIVQKSCDYSAPNRECGDEITRD